MVVVEEGEAFFVSAEKLRDFLQMRLEGGTVGMFKYGIGAGEPGDSETWADVTDISPNNAGTLLSRLEEDPGLRRAA